MLSDQVVNSTNLNIFKDRLDIFYGNLRFEYEASQERDSQIQYLLLFISNRTIPSGKQKIHNRPFPIGKIKTFRDDFEKISCKSQGIPYRTIFRGTEFSSDETFRRIKCSSHGQHFVKCCATKFSLIRCLLPANITCCHLLPFPK